MRNLSPGLLLGLAMAAPANAASGDMDVGLYTGLIIPGSNHELFAPGEASHKALNPGPALGGRFSFAPLDLLAGEGEAHVALASAQDAGGALLYAFRAQALLIPPLELPADIEPFLVAGLGDIGVSSSTDALGSDMDWAIHAGLGTKIPINEKLGLRFDVRYLFADRNTSLATPGGHTEALVGINYKLTPDGDEDGDGFVDSKDACPDKEETVNDWADDDGCPDALADMNIHVQDSDGVAIFDVVITQDGNEIGRTDKNGNLVVSGAMPDSTVALVGSHFHMVADVSKSVELVEGANDAMLVTEWLPGRVRVVTRNEAGPILDAAASFIGPKEREASLVDDGDQVFFLAPGEWSIIVAAATFGTERRDLEIGPDEDSLVVIEVELEPAKVEVTKEEMVILEKILFEVGSSGVDKASLGLIQEIANNIVNHGEINKVEIHGHTDSSGPASTNRKLSQARVEAVVAQLVKDGVDEAILVAIGHGEDDPIADNKTEEGRAENRRVQFLITEQE